MIETIEHGNKTYNPVTSVAGILNLESDEELNGGSEIHRDN